MPDRSSMPARPRDTNMLAKSIVEAATAEDGSHEKNPAAFALGELGGKKGGPVRAKKRTAEQRKEIARKAVQTRWSNASSSFD